MKNNRKNMIKSKKGFSLAELLISLMIVSIILAAAVPVITKRSIAQRDTVWKWANTDNIAYFGGHNEAGFDGVTNGQHEAGLYQTLLIGSNMKADISKANMLSIPENERNEDGFDINTSDAPSLGTGKTNRDKMAVFNKVEFKDGPQLKNAHISFYTFASPGENTDIKYSGKLVLDPYNIALGRGALQSLNAPDYSQRYALHNVAAGHLTLFGVNNGSMNTALGDKALFNIKDGNSNTAVGYNTLLALNSVGTTDEGSDENTAIGYKTAQHLVSGVSNVIAGADALQKAETAKRNTIIGSSACRYVDSEITDTICIGYGAGMTALAGSDIRHALFIGTAGSDPESIDLITGHTRYDLSDPANIIDKDIFFNTKNFDILPYNGQVVMKRFIAAKGYPGGDGTGYGNSMNNGNYYGISKTVLYYLYGSEQSYIQAEADTNSLHLPLNAIKITPLFSGKAYGKILYNDDFSLEWTTPSYSEYKFFTSIKSKGNLTFKSFKGDIQLASDGCKIPSKCSSYEYFGNIDGKSRLSIGDDTLKIESKYIGLSGNGYLAFINLTAQGPVDAKIGNPSTVPFNIHYKGTISIKTNETGTYSPVQIDTYSKYIHVGDDKTYKSVGLNVKGTTNNIANVWVCNDFIIKGLLKSSGTGSLVTSIKNIWHDVNSIATFPSDLRLKNVSGDSKAGLKEINQIKVKKFTYKNDKKKEPHVGVIAQDLQKIFPNSVIKDEKGYFRVKTEEMFYALVNAVKELSAKIKEITYKVAGVDKTLTELEEQNKTLKAEQAELIKRLDKLEKE